MQPVPINASKYHVSCTNGKISVGIKIGITFILRFHRRPNQILEWEDGNLQIKVVLFLGSIIPRKFMSQFRPPFSSWRFQVRSLTEQSLI